MKKFLLLVFIFLFGVISGAMNSAGFTMPEASALLNTPAEIQSFCGISDYAGGVLTNYRFSIVNQENSTNNQINVFCLYSTGKILTKQYFVFKEPDYCSKKNNQVRLSQINPRAP